MPNFDLSRGYLMGGEIFFEIFLQKSVNFDPLNLRISERTFLIPLKYLEILNIENSIRPYEFSKKYFTEVIMNFKLYTSNFKGNAQNCFYPNCIEIGNADDMKKAVAYDHVCSSFTDNKRSIANFKSSNVIVMDCDNDHSNEPDKWLTFDLIDAYFLDVNYVFVTSRNNNKAKGNASARPRFHIYFPIDETTDTNEYAQIKKAVLKNTVSSTKMQLTPQGSF